MSEAKLNPVMEKEYDKNKQVNEEERDDEDSHGQRLQQQHPPNISPMEPITHGAYGGGMYGTEKGHPEKPVKPPASDTQSADMPVEPTVEPKHRPPPSSGNRDIDITGQSYIV